MPPTALPPSRSLTATPILAVLAAGALVRLLTLRVPRLWYDEATVGIMALAVLRGELPVYFFGQPFMGALGDAYLEAPLLLALGASAGALELVSVLLSFAWLALVVRLAWEAFGPRAALLTAVVLAVPPDYLVRWSHEARPHYTLTLTLGALALLLALRTPAVRFPRALLHFGLLGLTLGLAFWTNFLSLVFFPAVAVLACTGRLRRTLVGSLVMVPAFGLGSLPHWLYGLRHGTAIPPGGDRVAPEQLAAHLKLLARMAWPMWSGVRAELHGTRAGAAFALALAIVYAAALVGAVRASRRDAPVARRASLALLVLVAVNIGVAVGTEYGRFLDDARYLLPLYTALPLLCGRWLAGLPGAPAAVLAGVLLVVHLAGALGGDLANLRPAVAAAQRSEVRAALDTIAALQRDGLRWLYAGATMRPLTFLSAERVIFADSYREIYPPYARAVDGAQAEAVGWWSEDRSGAFEATLRALGARFTFRPVGPLGGVYADFALRPHVLRELDPATFTVTASESAAAAPAMVDREAWSVWGTARPKRGGEWIQVDLGRIEPVALIRWLPGTYQEAPEGLRLEASLDGAVWRELIDVSAYVGPLYWSAGRPMGRVRSGRVELRPAPTPARYLRMTQTGRSTLWRWTIRELFVYAAASGGPVEEPSPDGATLARALRAAGVTRLYADHGWASRVALADPAIRVPPANLTLDAYHHTGSARDFLPLVYWTVGSGVLLDPGDADGFAQAAQARGLAYTRRSVEGLALFVHAPAPPRTGTPLPAAHLRVTASRDPAGAARAVDGDRATRWATARPQTAGDWLRIDLPTPRAVRAVRLWTSHATDAPRALALEGSEDGAVWRPIQAEVQTEGPNRWGGVALLRDGVDTVSLVFTPVTLRALRLTLTRSDPVFDWSVHELTVDAAD